MPSPLLDKIAALIRTPSVSSVRPALDMGNLAVIELLANWLEDCGFNVQVLPIAGYPQKANLVATLGQGSGGLVLSGHTDTVPYDEGRWQHDPFQLTQDGNRLYGLGTADMKSFFALVIEAVEGLNTHAFKHPLIILATADEESSMCGAKSLLKADLPGARYAIIGEPTDLQPVRMHKGVMMEHIRIIGKSGHSSDPALGNSALEGMNTVINTLQRFRAELQEKFHNPAFHVPVPTLNFGHIHGGDNPNRICGECELSIDLRPLPGMDIDELRAQIHDKVNTSLKETQLTCHFESLFEGLPAIETTASSEIVRSTEDLTGHTAGAVAFGTEAPYLAHLGLEVVILGPGSIQQAHQADEYISYNALQPTVALIQQLIQRFCLS